jgi:hypothetical protein
MSNSGVPDMLLTWHFWTVLLYMCVHPDHRAEWTSLVCNIWFLEWYFCEIYKKLGIWNFISIRWTKNKAKSFHCLDITFVNVFVLPRFDLCHVLFSSTNNFAHAQALSRMSSLSGHMNITRVNIGFFTGFKKIKQQRISFILGYLCMILWKHNQYNSIVVNNMQYYLFTIFSLSGPFAEFGFVFIDFITYFRF